MTKAAYARYVARILRRAAREMEELSQGMWNPDFCAADAEAARRAFFVDIRDEFKNMDGHDQRERERGLT